MHLHAALHGCQACNASLQVDSDLWHAELHNSRIEMFSGRYEEE